jgi:hypothetical protein
MKIIFLTEQQEKEIAKSFKKKIKITKILDSSLKNFCAQRYSKYFEVFETEIKNVELKSRKLKLVQKFLLNLENIFVSTNLFKGPDVPEGSAFKDGIILKYNLFYKDFKFAMIHEAVHFLFHSKRKIEKKKMEIEANTACFILLRIPPLLWKHLELPYDLSIWKDDADSLKKLKFKSRVITPEEYLWLKYHVLKWNKSVYERKLKSAANLIKKIRIENEKSYSLPFVFWPGRRIIVRDCIYLPVSFIRKNLKVFERRFYGRIKEIR